MANPNLSPLTFEEEQDIREKVRYGDGPDEPRKIVVTRRSDDYHASLGDEPGVWSCGSSAAEAIGHLIMDFPDRLGLVIEARSKTRGAS